MAQDASNSPADGPAVSVVMPVRDGESSLDVAISDIMAQSLKDLELIIVDDRSGDGSRAIAERWARRDRRIRVASAPQAGIVAALQHGCAIARSALIARMDADDQMHPDRLAAQSAMLDAEPHLGVVGCLVEFGGDPRAAAGLAAHVAWSNTLRSPQEIRSGRFIDAPIVHPSVMFRRDLLDRHGTYEDHGLPEDYELWLRWMRAGVQFGKVPRTLLRWNDPPTRLTRTDARYAMDRHAELKCRYLAAELADRSEQRPLWLWGAGRVTRRRFDALAINGLALAGYIDIDPRKVGQRIGGLPVVTPDDLPAPTASFIIAGVGVRGAGSLIRAHLCASGRREEADFIVAG